MGLLDSVASVVGGIAGEQAGAGDRGDARNSAIIANDILKAIQNAPDISKPLILEKYKQAGVLTPQMEQYITAQVPGAISTNPAYKQAQMQALQQMQQRATGGMTAADRAALHQAQLSTQGDVTSRLASIEQQAAQRGQAGGGSELAAKLMASQAGANAESDAADRLAMQQQQAREQALSQMGQFSGQLQAQDFGQQFQQQQAQNEMNRFNVSNQSAQQARNVGASNQAQAANLGNAQQISNANVGAQNSELNNQLQRQMQEAEYNRQNAQIKAVGQASLGNKLQQYGDSAAQNAFNKASGLVGLGGQIGSMAFGDFSGAGSNSSSGQAAENAMAKGHGGYAQGGQVQDFRNGGEVPGQANVPGDSPRNDTVHARLSPQEIVVPRSLAESKLGKELLKLIHAHNSVKNRLNSED